MTWRIALSGSAGTGKTTLAQLLARRLDLPLIPEAMRAHLEAGGARLDDLPPAEAATILASFRQDLENQERELGAFVADNGALDLEAYTRWYRCGSGSRPGLVAGRYDAVVLLPAGLLPYVQDGIRRDDAEEEIRFQGLLESMAAVSPLQSVLLRPPHQLRTPEARADWVIAQLSDTGRGLRGGAAGPRLRAEPA